MSEKILIFSSSGDPGHLFIRKGVERLIEAKPTIRPIQFLSVDKRTIFDDSSSVQSLIASVEQSEAIILAMGPVAWPYCERAHWANTLLHALSHASEMGKPICALALGSCYGYGATPKDMRKSELCFLSKMLQACSLITVRDSLMLNILQHIGLEGTLLPCIASFAFWRVFPPETRRDQITINYMRGAGHHDYYNRVDPRVWHTTVRLLVEGYKHKHSTQMICHSNQEAEVAALVAPELRATIIRDDVGFFSAVSASSVGIVNRVHAAIGLSGLEIPCVAIGTDTRLLAANLAGAHTLHVDEADCARITKLVQEIHDNYSPYTSILTVNMESAFREYQHLIGQWSERVGLK